MEKNAYVYAHTHNKYYQRTHYSKHGWWSSSKSEGANFDYEIWEMEIKA